MLDHHARRRSVDVGGLALALNDSAHGHGWGGWEEGDTGEARCVVRRFGDVGHPCSHFTFTLPYLFSWAELLSDMYNHTSIAVSDQGHDFMYVCAVSPYRNLP
jgi:hypothetical protein